MQSQYPLSKPYRSPVKRVRFGKKAQQNECPLNYKISRSKRYDACSDGESVKSFEDTSQICDQSQIETQRSGCDLERSRDKMSER